MKSVKRFFLVDDDTDDTDLFRDILGEVDPTVELTTAEHGLVALEKLEASPGALPDVLFLDLNMPKMNGKECLAALKGDDRFRHIPVIMYTTSSLAKDIEETIQNGAIGFIVKPSSLSDLKEILSSIAAHVHNNLEKRLRHLSQHSSAFIVC